MTLEFNISPLLLATNQTSLEGPPLLTPIQEFFVATRNKTERVLDFLMVKFVPETNLYYMVFSIMDEGLRICSYQSVIFANASYPILACDDSESRIIRGQGSPALFRQEQRWGEF